MSPFDIEKIRTFGAEITLSAADLIKNMRASGEVSVNFKGVRDLVTTADLAADKLISEGIKKAFPDHKILSEESASNIEALGDALWGPLWIIDPIDGTTNFAHGHHMTAVSVAFAYKGEMQFGAVCAPFINENYFAVRGGGATLNGKPIKTSEPPSLRDSLIATGFPYKRDDLSLIMKRAEAILKNCRDIRRIGACSLDVSWVACGRIDAYYEDVKPWDIAAAGLIAREAGAEVGHIGAIPKDLKVPLELYAKQVLVAPKCIFSELQRVLAA